MSNNGWSNQTNTRLIIVEGTPYSGLFFYSPAPGLGNLVGSWTAQAGTDPYGNSYPAGFAIYDANEVLIGNWSPAGIHVFNDPGAGSVKILSATLSGSTPLMLWASGAAPAGTGPAEGFAQNGLITAGLDTLAFVGPQSAAATDPGQSIVALFMTQGGATNGAQGQLQFTSFGSPNDTHAALVWASTYTAVYNEVAFAPGSSNPEAWHSFSGILNANWSTSNAEYRLMADQTVQFQGSITYTGNLASGSTACTLPVNYRPIISESAQSSNIFGGTGFAQASLLNTGALRFFFAGSPLTNPTFALDGFRYPVF